MEFEFFNNIWGTISSNPLYFAGGGAIVLLIAVIIKKKKKNYDIYDEEDVYHTTIPEKRYKKHDVESITIDTQEFENEYIINEDNAINITRDTNHDEYSNQYQTAEVYENPIENSKIFKNEETSSLIQSAIMLDNLGDRTQALSLLEKVYEIIISNSNNLTEDFLNEKNKIDLILSQYKEQLFEPTKSLELIIEQSSHTKLRPNLVEKKNETINDIFGIKDDAPTISSLLKNEENSSWLENQTNEAIHEIQQNKKDNEKSSDISPKGTIGNFSLEEDFNFNKKENNNEEQSQSFNIFDTGENHLENKTFNLHEDNVNKENNIFNTENHSKTTNNSPNVSKNTDVNDSSNENKKENDDLDVLSLLNEVKDVNEFNHAEKTESNNETETSIIEDIMLNIHNQAVSIEETNINEEVSEEELLKSFLEETKNKEDISTTDNQEPDTSEENKNQEDFMKEFSNMVVNLNNEVNNTPKKINDDSDTIWINWMLNQNGKIEMKNSTLDLEGKWGTKEAVEQLSLFLDSESGKLYNQEISWGVVSIQTLNKS